MIVCEICLRYLESREGNLAHRRMEWDDHEELQNADGECRCEWCGDEYDITDMYEI